MSMPFNEFVICLPLRKLRIHDISGVTNANALASRKKFKAVDSS